MKKLIKIMAVAVLMASSLMADGSLEGYNRTLSEIEDPALKQIVICERDGIYNGKNPEECIKVIDMYLKINKKITKTSLLRCELYGFNKEACKLVTPDLYNKTDKEYFDNLIAQTYENAGAIYSRIQDYENEVKMFKKALEFSPNDSVLHFNLGLRYIRGQGVETNKIKAYEHWRVAAKQGYKQAQKNLDILCGQSPWACK